MSQKLLTLRRVGGCVTDRRLLSSSEVATALRPFYLAVHPDFFGQYPSERVVNEESLKALHEYVTDLQLRGKAKKTEINFYIKDSNKPAQIPELKHIKVNLVSNELKTVIESVLKSCDLSLDYVNTLTKQKSSQPFFRPIKWHGTFESNDARPFEVVKEAAIRKTLRHWLDKHVERIRAYTDAASLTQVHIDSLCDEIVHEIGLIDIRWENVWGNSHYMGCLRTFHKLYLQQKERINTLVQGKSEGMGIPKVRENVESGLSVTAVSITSIGKYLIQGKTLVFSNTTGVNIHGEVVLGSEDVPTAWMTLLLSVQGYDAVLERLPRMEQELSSLLNGIRVARSNSQQMMMAQAYEVLLNKILNTLRRSQDSVFQEFRGEDLSSLEMVVEGESGPLAVTLAGQFLIPASIPSSLIIRFISENKLEAASRLSFGKMHQEKMEEVVPICKEELALLSLTYDENVSPQQMSQCCQRLLTHVHHIGTYLQGSKLRISTYYSVMADGSITIPWNWLED